MGRDINGSNHSFSKIKGKRARMTFFWLWIHSQNMYFFKVQSTYIESQVEEVFKKYIHRLHGFTKIVLSDRYPKLLEGDMEDICNKIIH